MTSATDVSDAEAWGIFNEHVAPVAHLGHKEVFKYKRGTPSDWKRSPGWSDVHRNRHCIGDVLAKTGGKNVHAHSFSKQLSRWLEEKGYRWSYSDVEAATYRLRAMLAQLRNYRRPRVAGAPLTPAPTRWPHLNAMLEQVYVAPAELRAAVCSKPKPQDHNYESKNNSSNEL